MHGGKVAARELIIQQITRVAAYGLVVRNQQILLCRISEQLASHAGQWTLPGGGLNFGEEPAAAMVREVREETGLIVRPATLANVHSAALQLDGKAYHAIRILYHTDLLGGSLTNEIDGSTDLCGWWSLEEARRLPLVDLAQTGLDLALS